ncbi:hypothetical protein [Neobacillus sp. LXY-1]|uniref:hypothetical protein n=1 Tax=Neobacillus sp. LXY-1 TaxID=3379133 RepID=UPI003EE0B737
MVSVMGYMSLFVVIGLPIAVIFLLVSVYKMKRNSEIQVEQNKRIIELLEKVKPGEFMNKQ